jgi:hypothetical protein
MPRGGGPWLDVKLPPGVPAHTSETCTVRVTSRPGGSWPYIPVAAGVAVTAAVRALTLAGTLGPTALLLRRADLESA